ncbi:hypothetical protein I5M16_19780 [Pseudomonas aeruginosa]|uniref:hypothetical protein n=1 Tax=Pseudomonas aeruginosa TaxID=287 RepID=UPI00044EB57A|nr:hypothetical protein [Pseudomonas aeruginosa]ETV05562.1 hypothetical protein Q051_01405 [Pseudomonas aeruginosa BWHPSA046]MBH3587621.1 hypothetical protein [Pseudomonas aeruginosa]MBH3642342.1 hypothetical protein [Pseudomonas aeruginosa]MBH3863409.1 hypothetical protein [Pseudomonas aeruginosa]MBH3875863.1 hypothetical protein [Pseudomonas aeruginosa]
MRTEVYQRGAARFDMSGRRLPFNLSLTGESITPGLAARLHRYAFDRLRAAGFADAIRRPAGLANGRPAWSEWDCTVYTMDADDRPADRSYCVRWKNPAGGYLEVAGILTLKGWPTLDHGLEIGEE